jgi:hypothetical protein
MTEKNIVLGVKFTPVSGRLGMNFFTLSDSWFPEEDDGVGHFLPAVKVFNMRLPEDIHQRLCLNMGL